MIDVLFVTREDVLREFRDRLAVDLELDDLKSEPYLASKNHNMTVFHEGDIFHILHSRYTSMFWGRKENFFKHLPQL